MFRNVLLKKFTVKCKFLVSCGPIMAFCRSHVSNAPRKVGQSEQCESSRSAIRRATRHNTDRGTQQYHCEKRNSESSLWIRDGNMVSSAQRHCYIQQYGLRARRWCEKRNAYILCVI